MPKLSGNYDPFKVEKEVREFWERNGIPNKVMNKNASSEKVFAFLEGPPTANGYMHIGHMRGRAIKDVYLRYKGMKGFFVWRQAGWDTQGLPVELEAEQLLGIKSKPEIEKVGVEKFVEKCNELVDHYISHWRSCSEKLGLWLKYDVAYQTRHENYIEAVWRALKKAHEMGLLIKSYKVVPACPRCETALSSHEVAQGYEEAEDPSVYVKFRVKGASNRFILIWTTTPWTLPANEAVAVNPELAYAWVRVGEEEWLVASELVEKVMQEVGVQSYEVVEEVEGKELEGLEYLQPLEDEVPAHKEHEGAHKVVLGDFVTTEEGTGCVHIAPAHGPEDFQVGKEYGLPVFCPVDSKGVFTKDGGKYEGLYFKDADPVIVEDLKRKGLLVYSGRIKHTYPFCWRCETPLIFRADEHWFLKVDPIKQKMLEENDAVKWMPKWAGASRFYDWLVNAEDWCISRSRYWGTPLPVWTCESCGEHVVIGSREELVEMALKLPPELKLHRPWIDKVVLKCPKCGGEMRRELYTVDVWMDSGMAHTASLVYFPDREKLFEKLFPYDLIIEGIDQTRGWFYTLLFTSVLLYGKSPYKAVICHGLVLDSEGRKMSKSKGNVVWAQDVMDRYGVDVSRLYLLMKNAPWDNLQFDYKEIEVLTRKMSIVWNVYVFAHTYMKLDKFDPEAYPLESVKQHLGLEDRWILSRLQSTVKAVEQNLESGNVDDAVRAVLSFAIDDISHVYLRSIKRKAWIEEASPEKMASYSALFHVLEAFTRLLAPFAPYLSEYLHRTFVLEFKPTSPESVHLCNWPRLEEEYLDPELEKSFDLAEQVSALAFNARQKAGLKIRWPVKAVVVQVKDKEAEERLKKLANYLKEKINTKELTILRESELPDGVRLVAKLKLKAAGKKLRDKTPLAVEALKAANAQELKKSLEENGVCEVRLSDGSTVELDAECLAFELEVPEYYSVAEGQSIVVYVDKRRDWQLEAEAFTRDIVRRIQFMRKEMDLNVEEYVNVQVVVESNEGAKKLEAYRDYVQTEVRAKKLVVGTKEALEIKPTYAREWDVDGVKVKIYIERLGA